MVFLLLTVLSVFCAALPMLGFLFVVWWLDRYDREPVWLIAVAFLWGAAGATSLALIGNTTAQLGLAMVFGDPTAATLTPVLVAPLVEEPTKALILFLIAISRHFDDTTDGFVYGASTGLGFGMTENLIYFVGAAVAAQADPTGGIGAWAFTVVLRTLYSAVMHATATSCVGAALGWGRFRSPLARLVAIPFGFACAIGTHALWNGLLSLPELTHGAGMVAFGGFVLLPFEFLLVFLVFQVCLFLEQRTIRRELQLEAIEQGTLPLDHVPILSSALRRGWSRWVPGRVDQQAYIRAATTLAFRRWQSRRARGRKASFYAGEVKRLRREVRNLLARA